VDNAGDATMSISSSGISARCDSIKAISPGVAFGLDHDGREMWKRFGSLELAAERHPSVKFKHRQLREHMIELDRIIPEQQKR